LIGSGIDEEIAGGTSAMFGEALAEATIPERALPTAKYEILEEVGRGGMGVIYRARQLASGRIVALKCVLDDGDGLPDVLERMRREATTAANLKHPNILPVYEIGEVEDLPFIAMKFATGGSLKEAAGTLRKDARAAVELMEKVARAVQYAHERGVVHRDLTPGNILLDSSWEPLVSDFGAAKRLDIASDLTHAFTVFGTRGFVAPEQGHAPASAITAAADVYSLGAILFDVLAGRPPFIGAHSVAVIQQAREQKPPLLRTYAPLIDRHIETICDRCLEADPSLRYPTAGALAEDLRRWLDGRSILARRKGFTSGAARWTKRNPMFAAAATTAIVFCGFAIVSNVQRIRVGRPVSDQTVSKRSVAVLPFLNLDSVLVDDKASTAVATALRTQVGRFGPAAIVGIDTEHSAQIVLAASADSRATARRAGVRTLLAGTTRTIGDTTRLSLRLTDPTRERPLLHRVIEVRRQQPVASAISPETSREISAALDSGEGAGDSDPDAALANTSAREFISAGDELYHRRTNVDLERAVDCYHRAIELAPDSALARAKLANAAVARVELGSVPELLATAEMRAKEAVQLNAESGLCHRALGGIYFVKGRFADAREEALSSVELDGSPEGPYFLGLIDKLTGRPDLALKWYTLARHSQRQPADNEAVAADCWADLIDDARAEAIYRRVSELHPELPEGWLGICRLRMLQHDFAAAQQIYEKNIDTFGGFSFAKQIGAQVAFFSRRTDAAERLYRELAQFAPGAGGAFFGAITYESALGRLRAMAGDEASARVILEAALDRELKALEQAPDHPEILYRVAAVESSMGENDDALAHLKAAFAHGWGDYRSTALDPRFDAIAGSDEFKAILTAAARRLSRLKALAVD
jgi:tetratricopeptide (TPR) repeat protein/TolB-like protein